MSTRALAAVVLGIAACSGSSSCSGAASSSGSSSTSPGSERADAAGIDPAKVILVSVAYPGASPEAVKHEVTEPCERAARVCTGIRSMWTTSRSEVSQLGVHVSPDVDTFEVMQCLRARLDEIARSLPPDAAPATIARSSAPPFALVTLHSSNASSLELRPVADKIASALNPVAGVTGTRVCGPEPETLVQIDPARARSLDVTTSEVIRALTLVDTGGPTLIRTQSPSIETLRKLTVRATPEVRLDDVATLSAGVEPNGCKAFDANGNEVIAIEVMGSPAAGGRLAEALEPVRSELPPNTAVEIRREEEQALLEAESLAIEGEAAGAPTGLGGVSLVDSSVMSARLSVWAPPSNDGGAWLARAAKAFGDPPRWQLMAASFRGTAARPIAFSLPRGTTAPCVGAARRIINSHTVAGAARVMGGGVARNGRTERQITVDRRHAVDLGIAVSDIAEVVQVGLAGKRVVWTRPGVRVRFDGSDWLDSADVAGRSGRVPVRSLIQETEGPAPGVFVGIDGHDKIVIRALIPFGARAPSAAVLTDPQLEGCGLEAADFAPSN